LAPRRSDGRLSVGYVSSSQDPRHYSWAVAAYALRSGRPYKGLLEVLALLRFRGLLNPVKHPAARLDNGTGFDPVSSHPIGYGTRLSVLFRPVLWEQGEGHAGLPARVRLPSVGAVGRLFLFERFASRYPCWLALAGIPPLTGVSSSNQISTPGTLGNV
jgi:hypothetical protein